jgi:hypothetical protein
MRKEWMKRKGKEEEKKELKKTTSRRGEAVWSIYGGMQG